MSTFEERFNDIEPGLNHQAQTLYNRELARAWPKIEQVLQAARDLEAAVGAFYSASALAALRKALEELDKP